MNTKLSLKYLCCNLLVIFITYSPTPPYINLNFTCLSPPLILISFVIAGQDYYHRNIRFTFSRPFPLWVSSVALSGKP